jgi:AcrR family transcriptional regulator
MAGTRQAPDRSRQKARTHEAIVDAAAAIVRQGRRPTVAEAARDAGVHRATAHRYFPTSESLMVEAALTASGPSPSEMVAGLPQDPFVLLDAVVRGVSAAAFANEAVFRTIVRVTIDRWFAAQENRSPAAPSVLTPPAQGTQSDQEGTPVPETRRFDYLQPALDALGGTVEPERLRRLRYALALVFGAEAVVVTRDVCRLDATEATDVMAWAAATLLRGALTETDESDTDGSELLGKRKEVDG